MFITSRLVASSTMCMTMPKRAKSVKRNAPGPYISMWVLEPKGVAKLTSTANISDMTKGRGSQCNSVA